MPRPPNVFSGPYLDRIAHLRRDDAWIAARLAGDDTWIVPVWRARNLLRREPTGPAAAFIPATQFQRQTPAREPVLLGCAGSRTYFAVEFEQPEPALRHFGDAEVKFEDLRLAGGLLDPSEAGVLAYARAMLYWRQRHRFCGACGAPTSSASAGHLMKCTNADCAIDHFPRLDPAIIVLVTDGERALLGRQASWPEGRYSTIAGFVEPGESLEDAVAREVFEETGVRIAEADYHSSQPWPFPSSLMIGFMATAGADQVPKADEELEDVRWFTRADIASGFPGLSPPQSVSYRLIEHWYDAGASVPLRQTPGVKLWVPTPR
ncbi:MAG TPA: NAD(+) diphosphatase [Steroidobacteraceae bacterium]|nr:NAD(+) diphosphatase [Steroidobacteraceae bacterium]